MPEKIVIEMSSRNLFPWRCLHEGPLPKSAAGPGGSPGEGPLARFRIRNRPLLAKLTQTYGACAVLASQGESIFGLLRFYPKAVWEMEGAGYLCVQQDFPAGPGEDFAARDFPPMEKLENRTLKVHCLQIHSPGGGETSLRRGIGTRMARKLIEWAGENRWSAIEADAFEDLPLIYQVTGSAGWHFWEKLGFSIADRFPHPELREYPEFTEKLAEQAKQAGIDTERAKDSIIMRLDLAS